MACWVEPRFSWFPNRPSTYLPRFLPSALAWAKDQSLLLIMEQEVSWPERFSRKNDLSQRCKHQPQNTSQRTRHIHTTLFCYEQHQPFPRGDRLYTSESDVCRRQILTYKGGPRTLKEIKNLMAVDP